MHLVSGTNVQKIRCPPQLYSYFYTYIQLLKNQEATISKLNLCYHQAHPGKCTVAPIEPDVNSQLLYFSTGGLFREVQPLTCAHLT